MDVLACVAVDLLELFICFYKCRFCKSLIFFMIAGLENRFVRWTLTESETQ